MVGGLLADFDLPQLTVGVFCRRLEHLDEQLLGGKVRAAGRGQIAAAGQQLHGAVVDLLVAAHGILNGAARLGEGGRVENDEVVGVALLFQPGAAGAYVVESIIHNQKKMIPCSVLLEGEYGESDLCIGVPVILGKNGIEKIVELELTADEKEKFAASAKAVHGTNAALKEVGAL